MSTADAAYDLELLRRAVAQQEEEEDMVTHEGGSGSAAVADTRMNYYGMSYGTALGVRARIIIILSPL